MDLRSWTAPEYNNGVKNMQKKKFALTTEQITKAAAIYHRWQEEGTDGSQYAEPELYRSVKISEIADNAYSLVPSRYIEFVDRDSNIDYDAILRETSKKVGELISRHENNQSVLKSAFAALGYDI